MFGVRIMCFKLTIKIFQFKRPMCFLAEICLQLWCKTFCFIIIDIILFVSLLLWCQTCTTIRYHLPVLLFFWFVNFPRRSWCYQYLIHFASLCASQCQMTHQSLLFFHYCIVSTNDDRTEIKSQVKSFQDQFTCLGYAEQQKSSMQHYTSCLCIML
jgi:hypothetical protein